MTENPNTPTGSMKRAASQGGSAAVIAYVLQAIASHNNVAVPLEIVLAVSTGLSTVFAGLWRKYVLV